MKKTYIVITVTIIVIISGVIGYFLFNKTTDNKKMSDIKKENNINTEKTVQENNVDMENTVSNQEKKEDTGFFGYTADEWKKMIETFYGNYNGIQLEEIICKYDEKGNYTADVATESEVCGEYVFDKKTGLATEKNIGLTVDFINGKVVNQVKDKKKIFTNNSSVAIGNITDSNEQKIIEKYFNNEASYNSITIYDFVDTNNQDDNNINRFIVIPKDEKVEISVYDCKIDENGKLQKDNLLIEKITDPFVIVYKNLESTTPKICLELNVNGSETIIPLVFRGNDEKLDLKGHEKEAVDITIY